jgi:uncharacterized protein
VTPAQSTTEGEPVISPASPFLVAQWRDLLMVNFAVRPQQLEHLVPRHTELDLHDGVTYVSLVAFQFLDTRVRGLRIPFHHSFEELNLRFYVRRTVGDEVRRAVVFIREVVPRPAIATMARLLYNEPYIALPMRHHVAGDPPAVRYEWRHRGQWQTLSATARGERVVPAPDDHCAFIAEHYWGYTRQRDGGTLEYEVTHPRWGVWDAELNELPDLGRLYGADWSMLTKPASVLIADGSAISVYPGKRI